MTLREQQRRRRIAALAVALAVCATLALAITPVSAADATSAFEPVRPCRLADTRAGTGFTRVDASTIRIVVGGRCGLRSDAVAAALTVTITEPNGAGFATVYRTGSPRPLASSGNVRAGETRATSTIARIGSARSIDIYASVQAHLVVDVTGGFVPAASAAAGRFVPIGPLRLADTRATAGRLGPGGRVAVAIPPGVPSDAVALAVNVTITGTSGPGFATAFATGDQLPLTSVVNSDAAGQTRSSTVIVPISAAGMSVSASVATDVVVDTFGYFTGRGSPTATTGLFTPADATRMLDTREVSPLGAGTPLYPAGGLEIPPGGTDAIAVAMVTAVDAAPGFLTAFAAGTARPNTATATISTRAETVANLAFLQRSDRGIGIWSHSTAHVVVDVSGWFSGVQLSATEPPLTNSTPPPAQEEPAPAAPPPLPAVLPPGTAGCTRFVPVAAPAADAERIGTSVNGRPIVAEHYGDRDGIPVLVVGPAHGDECSALAVVEQIRAEARGSHFPAGIHLVVIPTLNPDGLATGGRRNARAVDLNKDGAARTQPETIALMALTSRLQPRVSVHLHSPLSMVGGTGGPDNLGAAMAKAISDRTGLHLAHSAGGGDPTFLWSGQALVAPPMAAILVETPRGYPDEAPAATGHIHPGPAPGDDLWLSTAVAVLSSFIQV